jgi:hypothetical protein
LIIRAQRVLALSKDMLFKDESLLRKFWPFFEQALALQIEMFRYPEAL